MKVYVLTVVNKYSETDIVGVYANAELAQYVRSMLTGDILNYAFMYYIEDYELEDK